jgi:uncharacterized membrane protein
MHVIDAPRRSISSRRLAWLATESLHWQDTGAIDAPVRQVILDRYTTESNERRGLLALILVAVGMCSVGLLLLIGYNWEQIPRAAKLAIVIGSVIAAFGASTFAYARQKLVAAETLALFGVLLFGNAIWLVAQVLHIHGHDPDAFLWWGIGAIACAWLTRSKWIGVLAAGVLLVWVGAEGELSREPALAFLVVWPLAVAVAYSLKSSMMLRATAPAAGFWVFFGGINVSHTAFWLGGVALTGCALYGAGRWQQAESRMRRAWETSGLLVLLLVLIPLMSTVIHREMVPHRADPSSVAIAVAAALAATSASLRRSRTPADDTVLATAAAVTAWMFASWSGIFGAGGGFAISATVLFSIVALMLAVGLIRTALTSGEIVDLAAGVLFALVFLIVRWVSVIENLLWSGLLLLSAGVGLLVLARLWRGRARIATGRLS